MVPGISSALAPGLPYVRDELIGNVQELDRGLAL